MNAYFVYPDRRDWLERAAAAWLGTPFVEHGRIRGAGVDCANLVVALLEESGVAGGFALPRYTMDGGKHNAESQMTGWLDRDPRFLCVWHRDPAHHALAARYDGREVMPGDVLCFNLLSRSAHHAGVMVNPAQFVHAYHGRKVVLADLKDRLHQRCLTAVYRVMEGTL